MNLLFAEDLSLKPMNYCLNLSTAFKMNMITSDFIYDILPVGSSV